MSRSSLEVCCAEHSYCMLFHARKHRITCSFGSQSAHFARCFSYFAHSISCRFPCGSQSARFARCFHSPSARFAHSISPRCSCDSQSVRFAHCFSYFALDLILLRSISAMLVRNRLASLAQSQLRSCACVPTCGARLGPLWYYWAPFSAQDSNLMFISGS